MTYLYFILAGLSTLGAALVVLSVGKPRPTITPAALLISLILNGLYIFALVRAGVNS